MIAHNTKYEMKHNEQDLKRIQATGLKEYKLPVIFDAYVCIIVDYNSSLIWPTVDIGGQLIGGREICRYKTNQEGQNN